MKKLLLATMVLGFLSLQTFANDDEYDSSSDSDSISTEQEIAPESSQTNPNWYQNQEGGATETMDAPSSGDEEIIDDSSED